MRRLWTTFALASLLFSGCIGGGGGENSGSASTDSGAAPMALAPSRERDLPPVQGDILPLDGATITGPDGEEVSVKSLLAQRNLLYLADTEIARRRPRAATRAVRRVLQGGAELGFRVIMVAQAGVTSGEAEDFRSQRRLEAPMFRDVSGSLAQTTGWQPGTAALLGPNGEIMRLFQPAEGWDERLGFLPPLTDEIIRQAWEPSIDPPTLGDDVRQTAVRHVRTMLGQGDTNASPEGLDQNLESPLWVTLWRQGAVAPLRGRANDWGSSMTLGAALNQAVQSALDSAGSATDVWTGGSAAQVRVVIDVAGPSTPILGRETRSLWYELEPGIDGVVLGEGEGRGYIVPHDPVSFGWLSPRVRYRDDKIGRIMRELGARAQLGPDAWAEADSNLHRFRTVTFGNLQAGGEVYDWYRGNDLQPSMNIDQLLVSIDEGGRWLERTVQDDGRFDYEYFPNRDEGSRGYSIVRHAGSVYGLFEMWEFARHEPRLAHTAPDYLEAGSQALKFVFEALEVPEHAEQDDRICLVDERGRCSSGAIALALLTFLSLPDEADVTDPALRAAIFNPENDRFMERLAITAVDMIDSRGAVWANYRQAMTQDQVDREPLYFPGEVMLALTKLYLRTRDERWLNGATAIADRQVQLYREDRWATPDHWVMQAFELLARETNNRSYGRTLMKMSTYYVSDLYMRDVQPILFPDYQGCYRRKNDLPRTTRAGSRSEAIAAVIRYAWAEGIDATIHEDGLVEGVRHLVEQQYRPANSFWMADPARAHGAYRMGLVDNHIRIDNNQHALVGMIAALEVMRAYGEQSVVDTRGFERQNNERAASE